MNCDAIVSLLLEDGENGFPFKLNHGSEDLYITNYGGGDDMKPLFVTVGQSYSGQGFAPRRGPNACSAWDHTVAQKAVDALNAEYKNGKRDFTEQDVKLAFRTAGKSTPFDSKMQHPIDVQRAKQRKEADMAPATPEEKSGVEAIKYLQGMAGKGETDATALRGWRGLSAHEKEVTLATYSSLRNRQPQRN